MDKSKLSIWFFIGLLLTIYGVMILSSGLYEWVSGSYPAAVQLTSLHMPVWWGGVLTVLGLIYLVKFRPRTVGK